MGSKEFISVNKITEKMLPPHLRRKSKGRSLVLSFNPSDYNSLVSGEAIAKGNAVHLASDGLAYKADATNNKSALAFAMNDAAIGDTVYISTNKQIQIASASFTVGATVFLSTGTINVSTTIPILSNNFILQRLGKAVKVDIVQIHINTDKIVLI